MNNINNFYILSLRNLFETEIVANGAVLPWDVSSKTRILVCDSALYVNSWGNKAIVGLIPS